MSQELLVEELVERARKAQKQIEFITQEQADAAAKAICKVVYDNCEMLGKMAAEESRMGSIEDKITKCRMKSSLIWHSIKDRKSVGIINKNDDLRITEVAKPMGVVASVIPSTNPVVTPMSNGAFAMKTRNAVIFSPHPRAVECTKLLVKMFREELKKLGLPEDLILSIEQPTVEHSAKLMSEADVIVATGGMNMVHAAYSSGKPAFGVGAGNVQCIVDEDADLDKAAALITLGRTFDLGLICLGEQTVFVPQAKYDAFIKALEAQKGYYISEEAEVEKIREGLFPQGGPISRDVVGMTAPTVAKVIGVSVPDDTRMIVVPGKEVGHGDVLCREKMCPVLTVMPYDTFENGVAMMRENLEAEGKGHSISIHSHTPANVEYAAEKCPVSRVVVNQPAGTTGGGSPTNGFTPTTTLGCGSWGNNSFSGNFDFVHLLNISRIGYPLDESYLPDPASVWN